MFQDVYLFDDTIRANIALARPDATDAEIKAAARATNVHEFVDRLPHRYNTRVGEIGSALSGGERQRISIARAILKDAPVVLLDRPTAALDTESEVAVQRAIDNLVADKTVVVISHRQGRPSPRRRATARGRRAAWRPGRRGARPGPDQYQ
ncbi:ATP-binding cassette domain-containing protein [Streptomyces chattanoogensis]|uniref:ATP-binding cassette domain-containing protein n=1 Tax=Streptomyces chattanoogensis TaxID=66876 RepID=UPI001FE2131D|nr:ATP-binding cassette domain-containing protein [Streptomyces chattanoogensis]